MEEKDIIRLMPRKKAGVLRIVFSRTGLISLLVLLQVGLIFATFRWFDEYFTWITVVKTVFIVAMVFYLFNIQMDFSAKLTWLLLIMLVPVPASIVLVFSQNEIGHRMLNKRVAKLVDETRSMVKQDGSVLANQELVDSGTDDLCRYINKRGNFPIYDNTEATYLPIGEAKFEALVEELKKAEKFIFLEYFIISEGYMWGTVLKILADKVKEGVDVRVMYDGMCDVVLLKADYPKRMATLGIKCKAFSPATPFLSTQFNYRDHRKILVIDDKVAFTGGINMSDEYINYTAPFGHWKDVAVMVKGDAAHSFTNLFLQMWNITEKTPDWDIVKEAPVAYKKDGFIMPYADCPLDGDKVGENVYMDMLYRAKSYVHIMTPYLILDNEMERALIFAAERGVDVKIILPGIPDKKYAYALATTHFKALLKAGVKIYEYTPGFVHAKVFVCDDEKAVVGTINLDYRSLYLNFECATYMYKASCIADIEKDYEATIEKCREITVESNRKSKLIYKAMGAVLKPIAPLM